MPEIRVEGLLVEAGIAGGAAENTDNHFDTHKGQSDISVRILGSL